VVYLEINSLRNFCFSGINIGSTYFDRLNFAPSFGDKMNVVGLEGT